MSIRISCKQEGESFYPLLQAQGWGDLALEVGAPAECGYLFETKEEGRKTKADCSNLSFVLPRSSGVKRHAAYTSVHRQLQDGFIGTCSWAHAGYGFDLSDTWRPGGEGKVLLERSLRVSARAGRPGYPSGSGQDVPLEGDGFQLQLALKVVGDNMVPEGSWRFFAPGMLYGPDQFAGEQLVVFSDHRLAYPLVMAYQQQTGRAICLSRVDTASFDTAAVRMNREQRYLQKTDVGSVGFSRETDATPALHLFWPYFEGEKSALLDAAGSPASAYYPLDGPVDLLLRYEIMMFEAENFAGAVLAAFKNAYALARPLPEGNPGRPNLPFSLEEAMEYRLSSLQKTYSEWADGGAGFILNFDPERGYDSQAKAFGASFTTHDTADSHSILEYGFTGRQLNAAFVLAEHQRGAWLERGKRVVDFFVDHLTTPYGWMYTLYHLDKARPLYTVGDPDGPVMHYLATSRVAGNYTRMMVEAAIDLLLNYRLHKERGASHERWLHACVRFADFLMSCQNSDGSWYRAYTPAGEGLGSGGSFPSSPGRQVQPRAAKVFRSSRFTSHVSRHRRSSFVSASGWFSADAGAAKSASSIPVPYLLALAEELGERGEAYRAAAQAGCEYLLREQVAIDDYRGGTLDNPNVVDKEAAMLTMTALLHMYEQSARTTIVRGLVGTPLIGDKYLSGAERAARLAVTWNSIWNVPLVPGTRLHEANVQSTGWGGINSTWGAGVTDIYSLFFLAELVRLSRLTGEQLYADIAELIAHGTQQILSHPGNLFGFADIGMQPEGIAFCSQGVDDGLIAKGDIWGGLGWIYTAGTYGLSRYLLARGPAGSPLMRDRRG